MTKNFIVNKMVNLNMLKLENKYLKSFIQFAIQDWEYDYKKQLDKTYRYQINTYMWLLGLKKSFFVFENKNTQEFHVEPCELDENIINDIKDRIERLHKCIDDKAPPAKEYDASNWHCEYCSFNKLCYGPDYKGKR